MATKEIKTRIALRTGDYAYWTTGAGKDIELYKGEVCICTIDTVGDPGTKNGAAQTAPTVLFKVANANGQKFADLNWVSGLGADVYEWAKKNGVKVVGGGNAITNAYIKDGYLEFNKGETFATKGELEELREGLEADTNTTYQFSIPTVGDDKGKLLVEKKEIGETEWTKVDAYDFVTPDELDGILADYYTKLDLEGKIHTEDDIKAMEIAHATAAGKVDTAITVKVGGADVVFDGSEAKTADVDAAIAAAIDAIPDVVHPEYSIVKDTTSDYAATYHLTKDGVNVGTAINIPKDMVVEHGEVKELEAGTWGEAGTYIVITLANATDDKLYINVGDLIEYVTGGATADITVTVDPATHVVTASLTTDATDAIAKGVAAKAVTDNLKGLAFQDKIDNTDIDDNTIAIAKLNGFNTAVAAIKVTNAGNADTLGTHAPEYFATAERVKALEDAKHINKVEADTGLKVIKGSTNEDNKVAIDTDVVFVLDCNW